MLAGRRGIIGVGFAALLIGVVGCGKAKRGAVSGQVTLDGQTVDGGEILFLSTAGTPAWAKIVKGRYAIDAATGPSFGTARVEIRWPRKTGKRLKAVAVAASDAMIEETIEVIPARYNSRSELTAKIEPGKNQVNFDLKRK